VRSDSIAVLSRTEILGMSQDSANLWTYQVRRIPSDLRKRGKRRNSDRDDD